MNSLMTTGALSAAVAKLRPANPKNNGNHKADFRIMASSLAKPVPVVTVGMKDKEIWSSQRAGAGRMVRPTIPIFGQVSLLFPGVAIRQLIVLPLEGGSIKYRPLFARENKVCQ
jgi:hypothetical protein